MKKLIDYTEIKQRFFCLFYSKLAQLILVKKRIIYLKLNSTCDLLYKYIILHFIAVPALELICLVGLQSGITV